jgi:hypothetical protein
LKAGLKAAAGATAVPIALRGARIPFATMFSLTPAASGLLASRARRNRSTPSDSLVMRMKAPRLPAAA